MSSSKAALHSGVDSFDSLGLGWNRCYRSGLLELVDCRLGHSIRLAKPLTAGRRLDRPQLAAPYPRMDGRGGDLVFLRDLPGCQMRPVHGPIIREISVVSMTEYRQNGGLTIR